MTARRERRVCVSGARKPFNTFIHIDMLLANLIENLPCCEYLVCEIGGMFFASVNGSLWTKGEQMAGGEI